MDLIAEERRLHAARQGEPWRRWGPYLSERQWGTVREDYSEDGDAWAYFTHDQARSRAYRWGEDGIAGLSDERQQLCLAIALWNEEDPILKERFFGLTNAEGNHGEDVKEYYFFLDNLPTHSYQRMLYKYPQAAFPYAELVQRNAERSRHEMEYELIDTGVFDEGRYFDVEVEYAKADVDDIVCRVTVHNRGPEPAPVHVLPTLWFRNTWSWEDEVTPPCLRASGDTSVQVQHEHLGEMVWRVEDGAELLFCENESNSGRLWGSDTSPAHPKDAINDRVVAGAAGAVNPARVGTKAAAWFRAVVPAGESVSYRVRLSPEGVAPIGDLVDDVDAVIARRRAEADEFYTAITPASVEPDAAAVMRQALAGMLWSKQTYLFDLDTWLREHDAHPLRAPRRTDVRNQAWFHMYNHDVVSMPDTWEYPWYAAWDLAFHCIPLMMVDPDFAKSQLDLMLSPAYQHPDGQIPAYEWNFGDVNPPVHAFATLLVHSLDVGLSGKENVDLPFLKASFAKLLVNFSWWVNRKDTSGRNLFEGGFLGLDNIGVFDRSKPLPTGGRLEQADGTAWMALYSQNMLEIAMILAADDPTYEDFITRFLHRFFLIAASMDPLGDSSDQMWDDEDGFFYDVLRLPDGTGVRLKVRSLVGLLPLCATIVVEEETLAQFPRLRAVVADQIRRNADLLSTIADPLAPGVNGRRLLSLVDETKLRRILARMLDEERFLGPHGIRSLSRVHLDEPYEFDVGGTVYSVQYEPAESTTGMFGGNSNWRGPVWFPVNLLIIRALLQHYQYYGDAFRIECPTGSGNEMTLFEVAKEIADRLVATFLPDDDGRRPVYGETEVFQTDEHWKDLVLFYEYFHGDNGAGLGASHQTGWTGIVARLIQMFAHIDAEMVTREGGRPVAQPFRRIADSALGDAETARRARGAWRRRSAPSGITSD